MSEPSGASRDFIRTIIAADVTSGKHGGRVQTRFPPEPNGYLHIGHAKAILLNHGIAEEFGGHFNLRFDDTNPVAEEEEFVEGIKADVAWLGADWEDRLYFASDYFPRMYELAEVLIQAGKAYIDDCSVATIREMRGDLTTRGRECPHRDRTIEENLDRFRRMRAGEFPDGTCVLRAQIDMAHPNLLMRDPVMYRIIHASHHRTGPTWCIYPTYDWAHGLEDSIEEVTHSLCSLEFEIHRPLYDWFLQQLPIFQPRQIEFARLNLSYTVLSKRNLRKLVEGGHISGWDDPRVFTLRGLRRRGVPPGAIRAFTDRVGVAKMNSTIAIETWEANLREYLNSTAPRRMGVLDPLEVIIENPGEVSSFQAVNNPEDLSTGTHEVPFSPRLWVERRDFMVAPPKRFHRLAPGKEIRLRYAYLATHVAHEMDGDEVRSVTVRIDPDSKGGDAPDGRKVKGTIHWVSADHAITAEVRLYDRLFNVEDPMQDGDVLAHLDPTSLTKVMAKVEPSVRELQVGTAFQFERTGYFTKDPDSTPAGLVLNRTVGLRDTWARIQASSKATRA